MVHRRRLRSFAFAGALLAAFSCQGAPAEDDAGQARARHKHPRRHAHAPRAPAEATAQPPALRDREVADSFSKMLDPSTPLSHPASERALEMLGAQYRWGGTVEETGMDCSGFVLRSYKDAVGLELPRSADQMANGLDKVLPHEMRAGDLVFFNTMGRPHSHVGIYLGGSLFAHSPRAGQKARIDDLTDHYWLAAFDGARRPSARPSKEALARALHSWDPALEPASIHTRAAALPPLPPSMLPKARAPMAASDRSEPSNGAPRPARAKRSRAEPIAVLASASPPPARAEQSPDAIGMAVALPGAARRAK